MFQTLIIGAGVAGLAAGRELLRKGQHPLILEARDRIGGRVLTVHDRLSPLPLELGAEMVHGLQPELWEILRECAAISVEMNGVHLTRDSQGLHQTSYFEEVDRVFERMAGAGEQSFAEFLSKDEAPAEVKALATGFVEGFNAARKEDVSVAWLNRENDASASIDGERNFRLVTGYDAVPAHLSHGLDIRLSTIGKTIRWAPGSVVVNTDRGEFRGSQAIVTVPFSVLRDRAIELYPEPPELDAAREAIATGDAMRITFRFRAAPWEKHKRLSFLHGDQPFPVWWTPFPVRAPLITGWAAGPKAAALNGRTREEVIAAALASLRDILGEDFDPPETAHFHNWRVDPFSQGAYSYVRVGGLQAQAALAEPFGKTLFFAGEALDLSGHVGTVHGAIASGLRAARLV